MALVLSESPLAILTQADESSVASVPFSLPPFLPASLPPSLPCSLPRLLPSPPSPQRITAAIFPAPRAVLPCRRVPSSPAAMSQSPRSPYAVSSPAAKGRGRPPSPPGAGPCPRPPPAVRPALGAGACPSVRRGPCGFMCCVLGAHQSY